MPRRRADSAAHDARSFSAARLSRWRRASAGRRPEPPGGCNRRLPARRTADPPPPLPPLHRLCAQGGPGGGFNWQLWREQLSHGNREALLHCIASEQEAAKAAAARARGAARGDDAPAPRAKRAPAADAAGGSKPAGRAGAKAKQVGAWPAGLRQGAACRAGCWHTAAASQPSSF